MAVCSFGFGFRIFGTLTCYLSEFSSPFTGTDFYSVTKGSFSGTLAVAAAVS